jgi:hypothetical protein
VPHREVGRKFTNIPITIIHALFKHNDVKLIDIRSPLTFADFVTYNTELKIKIKQTTSSEEKTVICGIAGSIEHRNHGIQG